MDAIELLFKRLRPASGVLVKYKMHHILFWALYHMAWWTFYTGDLSKMSEIFQEPHLIIKYLGYVMYQAFGVYFCLYVLIPRYLQKGRYVVFFLAVVGIILLMAMAITFNYYVSAQLTDKNVYDLFGVSPQSPWTLFKHNALPSSVGATTLGMSIKLAKIWLDSQKRQQLLEKEKLETELKFLKSQFNPHFLFNTINSIFVLINKNPEMASESLVKFSSLLRYQLYECNTNQIPLANELAYIASFMELESLRQNDNFELKTNFPNDGTKHFSIAPFILIPFVENAFKHLSEDLKLKKWIHLNIGLEGEKLQFGLTNSANFELEEKRNLTDAFGGLGLKNVKRRLDIIYPSLHSLVISKGKDTYSITLELMLQKDEGVVFKKVGS